MIIARDTYALALGGAVGSGWLFIGIRELRRGRACRTTFWRREPVDYWRDQTPGKFCAVAAMHVIVGLLMLGAALALAIGKFEQ